MQLELTVQREELQLAMEVQKANRMILEEGNKFYVVISESSFGVPAS